MMLKNIKNIINEHKLPPCSIYDIPAMETWLSDMAKKGWYLKKTGRRYFRFEKKAPSDIRCRLEPVFNNQIIPDGETQEFYADAGWEYITTADRLFYIWRSTRRDARELHSDPIIQSTAYELVCRQLIKNAAIMTLAAIVFLAILICGFTFAKRPVQLFLASPAVLLLVPTETVLAVSSVLQAAKIIRLKHALSAGISASHYKNYKKQLPIRYGLRCLFSVFSLAFLGAVCFMLISSKRSTLSEIHGVLPYLPLDIIEEQNPTFSWHKDSLIQNGVDAFNSIEYSWSPLVPVHYDIYQQGEPYGIYQDDAAHTVAAAPSAKTEYFRLFLPSLALPLFHEMTETYIDKRSCPIVKDSPYPGLDRVVTAKTDNRTQLFALCGCQVLYICYYGNEDITQKMGLLAETLKRM